MSKKRKFDKSSFWFWFFFLILPIMGVIITVISFVTDIIPLMLLALPMLMSFFVTAAVVFISAIRSDRKEKKEQGVHLAEDYSDYKGSLNLSDEMIMTSKNPYGANALKSLLIIALIIIVPLVAANLPVLADIMLGDLYLKNILKALPIFLVLIIFPSQWTSLRNFLDFWQAKRFLKGKETGKKAMFLFPKVNLLSILWFALLVVMAFSFFGDVRILRDYKENGTAVEAEIYKVERIDDEDRDVYFKYTYEGKEYSYTKRNYSGENKIGHTVVAYLKEKNPAELYIYYSNAFAVYIMLGGFCFFMCMENMWRKITRIFCYMLSGGITLAMGLYSSATVHTVFGIIMFICAFFAWISLCKTKKYYESK